MSLLHILSLALVGGFVLNLMPCVFPVLGIKILGFVHQAGREPRKVTAHGVAYSIGVLLSFWALASALAVLRAGGVQLGWGFQLQSASFVFGLAAIVLLFALNLSGVFEVGMSAMDLGPGVRGKASYASSFVSGVFATVVATPCSAPFLAPALGVALVLPLFESFLVFTAIGIGFAAPYLLLSLFPGAVRLLPRPGRWMGTLKQAMAFPLYATVGWLIWVLAGQTNEDGFLMSLLGLTSIAMAAWLYGHFRAPGSAAARGRIGLIGGVVLFLMGLQLGWPRAVTASEVVWEPWSAEQMDRLRAEGRPIYVDFTARWCATCQTNKKVVFGSAAVKRYFHDHHVAVLKADLTNSDPGIVAALAAWNRVAVPFNLVYRVRAEQPTVLPEILTPAIVLAAFRD